jgi:LacI family transcriptional regulator
MTLVDPGVEPHGAMSERSPAETAAPPVRRESDGSPPTMEDVAQLAQVSRQTVWRVLHAKPRVSERARSRVLEAIRTLGYRQNQVASSLRTGRTRTIGLLLPSVTEPYLAAELRAIQDAVERSGYRIVLYNTDQNEERERECLSILNEHRVEGAIVMQVSESSKPALHDFAAKGAPLVVVNAASDEIDCVISNNRGGTRLATEHLISHGHRRIGLVLASRYISGRGERMRGYQEALAAHGLEYRPDLVASTFDHDTPENGRAAVLQLLDQSDPPSALITGASAITFGAFDALSTLHLRAGHDLALISNSHITWAPFLNPPLSMVSVEPQVLGLEAARILLGRLSGEITGGPIRTRVECTASIRASCGTHDGGGLPSTPEPTGATA